MCFPHSAHILLSFHFSWLFRFRASGCREERKWHPIKLVRTMPLFGVSEMQRNDLAWRFRADDGLCGSYQQAQAANRQDYIHMGGTDRAAETTDPLWLRRNSSLSCRGYWGEVTLYPSLAAFHLSCLICDCLC